MSNYKRRSAERVAEIDDFISKFYEKQGPQYCAEKLNEKKNYIFSRAHILGIRYESSEKFVSKANRRSKNDRQQSRIDELMNINGRLRTENIKIIHENMLLKRDIESDSRIVMVK